MTRLCNILLSEPKEDFDDITKILANLELTLAHFLIFNLCKYEYRSPSNCAGRFKLFVFLS